MAWVLMLNEDVIIILALIRIQVYPFSLSKMSVLMMGSFRLLIRNLILYGQTSFEKPKNKYFNYFNFSIIRGIQEVLVEGLSVVLNVKHPKYVYWYTLDRNIHKR